MEGNRYKRGHWSLEEDKILMDYISIHGKGRWNRIAKATGLKRCGKSCRLRWMNYLSPTIKKGNFSQEEDDLIIRLHKLLGNRWSLIAGRIPGRTDNQVKNHWNTHLSKRLRAGKNISNEAESSLPSSSQDSVYGGEKLNVCQKEVARSPKQLVDGTGVAATNEEELIQQHQQPLQVLDEARSISDRSLSSIWVANSDRNLDMIPSLVELLDGFPLDILWHDF